MKNPSEFTQAENKFNNIVIFTFLIYESTQEKILKNQYVDNDYIQEKAERYLGQEIDVDHLLDHIKSNYNFMQYLIDSPKFLNCDLIPEYSNIIEVDGDNLSPFRISGVHPVLTKHIFEFFDIMIEQSPSFYKKIIRDFNFKSLGI